MQSIEQRLAEYNNRVCEITDLEVQLVEKRRQHEYQTKLDFGIADGDVLSVGHLVDLCLNILRGNDEQT